MTTKKKYLLIAGVIIFICLALTICSGSAYWYTQTNATNNSTNQSLSSDIVPTIFPTTKITIPTITKQPTNNLSNDSYFKNRALMLVVENNDTLSSSEISIFDDNSAEIIPVLSMLFKVPASQLQSKSIVEIVDDYGEDWMIDNYKKAAPQYTKHVILTDETASYDNFKKELLSLADQGYTIDILFSLHGNTSGVAFYDDFIYSFTITEDLAKEDLDIGFVYQTMCYGSHISSTWIDIGAKVTNGSKRINSFPIYAPQIFLQEWRQGESFETAVNDGMHYEINMWKNLEPMLPEISEWTTKSVIDGSIMLFEGDKDIVCKEI